MHYQIQMDHRNRQGLDILHRLHRQGIDQKFQRLRRRKTLDRLPGGYCRALGRGVQFCDHQCPPQSVFHHRLSAV